MYVNITVHSGAVEADNPSLFIGLHLQSHGTWDDIIEGDHLLEEHWGPSGVRGI